MRRTLLVEDAGRVEQSGEGVQQFKAGLRLMLAQTRVVASADATTGDFKVVARATGDTRQFRLALVEFTRRT